MSLTKWGVRLRDLVLTRRNKILVIVPVDHGKNLEWTSVYVFGEPNMCT